MTAKIVVRPLAKADLADAYSWYEGEQVGLGKSFLDQIGLALNRIAARPEGYPVVEQDVRRALVRRFPFSIYFRVQGDIVRVIAVIHQRRHPNTWRRRARRSSSR